MKRQPPVPSGAAGAVTGHLRKLDARARSLYDGEREALERVLAPTLRRLSQVKESFRRAERSLPAGWDKLADAARELERGQRERAQRRGGGRPESRDEQIRAWEDLRRLEMAVAAHQRVVDELEAAQEDARSELTALVEEVTSRVRLGNTRVQLAADYIAQRQARYLSSLVDSHPHGNAIQEAFAGIRPQPPPTFRVTPVEETGEMFISTDNGHSAD